MSAPAIEAQQLSKSFPKGLGWKQSEVLHDICFEVEAGRQVGLIGPNGSGKSTLQRLLAGADVPTRGALRLFGQSPSAETRARVGYLPEDSPFPAELSARAALDLLGSLQAMSRVDTRRRGDELLERVGLARDAHKSLGRYSRGMLRRFGLAQAWLHRPDLLLLDEPTAGLDAPGFDVLEDLLGEARSEGTTVVISSHLIGDLQRHCDELLLLSGGRLAARGGVQELLARPGCWRLELERLSESELAELEQWVSDHGGRVLERSHSGRTLFELYHAAAQGAQP
jgi:ABC-2 type transport system ATP-binding protein